MIINGPGQIEGKLYAYLKYWWCPLHYPYAYKNKLFVSCNGPERNRVGRSAKKKICIIFLVKNVCFMHVFRWFGVGRAEKTLGWDFFE